MVKGADDTMELEEQARNIRKKTLDMMGECSAGHPGGSLSQVEILVALYWKILHIDPKHPADPQRDRLVVSKGHTCASLYVTLAEKGYFDGSELYSFSSLGSILQGHPDRNKTPGIETSSGSLGQGLSQAVGMALAARKKGRAYTVYALLGDGELDSGQIWEALMAASHYRLDNLVIIVDCNKMQAKGNTSDIMNLGDLHWKLSSFIDNVFECDGHNIPEILSTFKAAVKSAVQKKLPAVIISNTVKGKGVSMMENVPVWHNAAPSRQQAEIAIKEIG